MNINTLDLNLLRVFDAIMKERSITAAGAKLGLTQSAASNALKRLRAQCKDQLFVRTVEGMAPTSLANELAEPIANSIATIKEALERDRRFVPSESQRHFRLLMTDTGDLMFLPTLMAHLQDLAPDIRISCQQIPREKYGEALEAGSAEIALGMLPTAMRDFAQQRLRDERLVCLVSNTNKAIGATLSLKQYLSARHVAMLPPSTSDKLVVRALGKQASKRSVVLEVQHYLAVPLILQNSNFLAVVPQTVATALAPLTNLRIMPLPFQVPLLPLKQYWHRRSNNDPGHRWLRGEIAKLFVI